MKFLAAFLMCLSTVARADLPKIGVPPGQRYVSSGTAGNFNSIYVVNGATVGQINAGTTVITSGKNITVSGGGELLGLPGTPSGATAAASKSYVDAVALVLSTGVGLQSVTPGVQQIGSINFNGTALVGGNLGVKTQTPATTLDVVGDFQWGSGAVKSTGSTAGALTVAGAFTTTNASAITVNSTATFKSLAKFTNTSLSTSAVFSGWSRTAAVSQVQDGTLQIGQLDANAGILDYNATANGIFGIENTYNASAGQIRLGLKTLSAATAIYPFSVTSASMTLWSSLQVFPAGNVGLNLQGYGSIAQFDIISNSQPAYPIFSISSQSITNGTIMQVLGNGNVGIGNNAPAYKFQVTNAVSTAAVFNGWTIMDSAANAAHGSIQLGSSISNAGFLDYSNSGQTTMTMGTTYSNAASKIQFVIGTQGTGTSTPLSLTGDGNVSVNSGTNIVYYCNGGVSVGNLCRGNGCSCTAGTWVATHLKLD